MRRFLLIPHSLNLINRNNSVLRFTIPLMLS